MCSGLVLWGVAKSFKMPERLGSMVFLCSPATYFAPSWRSWKIEVLQCAAAIACASVGRPNENLALGGFAKCDAQHVPLAFKFSCQLD